MIPLTFLGSMAVEHFLRQWAETNEQLIALNERFYTVNETNGSLKFPFVNNVNMLQPLPFVLALKPT